MKRVIHYTRDHISELRFNWVLCTGNFLGRYVTNDPTKVTCKKCRQRVTFQKDLEKELAREDWEPVRNNSPSIKLGPVEQEKRTLTITTKPLTPAEAAVVIDTLLDRIPEFIEMGPYKEDE